MTTFDPYPTLSQTGAAAQAWITKLEGTSTLTVPELANAGWTIQGYGQSIVLPLGGTPPILGTVAQPKLADQELKALLGQVVAHSQSKVGSAPLTAPNWLAIILALEALVKALLGQ